MNISYIETFLTIVETQSISKAAEKLFLSQSTVSNRLNVLENDLNAKLIERNQGQRFISLTPKGEEFVNIAKRWIALHKDTSIWIRNENPLKLSIGSVDSINSHLLINLYEKIIHSEPSYELDISSHWSNTIFGLLGSYQIDVGIVPRLIQASSLLSKPIFSEELVVISSLNYSTYESFIHPEDLDVKKEIFLDWGASFRIWHDSWWDPTDSIEIKADTVGLVLRFINRPNAWAIMPEAIAQYYKKSHQLKISKFIESPPKRICYKIIHRNPLPRIKKPLKIFETYLERFIEDNPFLTKI